MMLMVVISLIPTILKMYKAILPFTAKSNKTSVDTTEDNKYIEAIGIIASKYDKLTFTKTNKT